jgi:hypothetical protein
MGCAGRTAQGAAQDCRQSTSSCEWGVSAFPWIPRGTCAVPGAGGGGASGGGEADTVAVYGFAVQRPASDTRDTVSVTARWPWQVLR